MNLITSLSAPTLAFGLLLTTGASAQVVQERPATGAERTSPENTAILQDDDRIGADRDRVEVRRVSEVLSGEARGPGDEGRLAAIDDMIMDGEGRAHYILLSRGGVAGVGGEKIAVPINAGNLVHNENGNWELMLNMTGDRLDQAPTLEDGSLASLRDENWKRTNQQFFEAEAAGDQAETTDDTFLFRASALKDAQVRRTLEDDSIANVDDVTLDEDFRASYAILGYGGVAGVGKTEVPVPFRMLVLTAEQENDRYRLFVSTEVTKEQLQSDEAPQIDGEYERMLDPTFLERVNAYFGAERSESAIQSTP
jgi:hypothetical protein